MRLPDWAINLTHADRLRLIATLEHQAFTQAPSIVSLEQAKTFEDWKAIAENPAYLILREVQAGSQLQAKDIILPDVSTKDDSPLEGFMADCYTEGEYATMGEFYASLQEDRIREWGETVRIFEQKPNDFYNAWRYLDEHPAHWRFSGDNGMTPPEERITEWNLHAEYGVHAAVDIHVTQVNHATGRHEDDLDNTLTEVWIELGNTNWPSSPEPGDYICKGEIYPRDYSYHDTDLDCGGPTMESAIISAAVTIHTHYGNDRRICDKTPDSVSGNG